MLSNRHKNLSDDDDEDSDTESCKKLKKQFQT